MLHKFEVPFVALCRMPTTASGQSPMSIVFYVTRFARE